MSEPNGTSSARLRVALVDDNDFDTEYSTIILSKAGFTGKIAVYWSAEEALQAYHRCELVADLMFLDINMLGMSGFDLARTIAACPSIAPLPTIVMLTSSPAPSDIATAGALAIVAGIITKPLTTAAAAAILHDLPIPHPRPADHTRPGDHHGSRPPRSTDTSFLK